MQFKDCGPEISPVRWPPDARFCYHGPVNELMTAPFSRTLFLGVLALSGLCAPLSLSAADSSKKSKPDAKAKAKTDTKPDAKPKTAEAPKGAQGAIGAPAPLPRIYAPTRPREVTPVYPWKKNVVTTIFWIGETPTQNNPTPNHKSSWDTAWQINFGGFDDPDRENRSYDFRPKNFIPRLNPFYVALPFNDLTNKEIAKLKIPWAKTRKPADTASLCKGVWLAIRLGNKTCFAQWEDCGPFVTDDHNYVFGTAPPKNPNNNGAGLDVSPAVRDFLGMTSGMACDWRFCAENEVPDGPWRRFGVNSFAKGQQKDLATMRAEYQELVRKREEYLKRNPPPSLRQ